MFESVALSRIFDAVRGEGTGNRKSCVMTNFIICTVKSKAIPVTGLGGL
jgi:hypothetical protein